MSKTYARSPGNASQRVHAACEAAVRLGLSDAEIAYELRWRGLDATVQQVEQIKTALGAEPPDASWTDERVATLRKLWAEGLSARQIAEHLRGVSRNAVIGKITRLGLTRKGGKAPRRPRPIAPPSALPPPPRRPPAAPAAALTPRKPVAAGAVPPPPCSGGVPLLDLEARQCRWPVHHVLASWPDVSLFCGAPVGEGQPYCAHHRTVGRSAASVPPREPRAIGRRNPERERREAREVLRQAGGVL